MIEWLDKGIRGGQNLYCLIYVDTGVRLRRISSVVGERNFVLEIQFSGLIFEAR